MDYWKSLKVVEHDSWEAFRSSPKRPGRLWLFTTRGSQTLWEIAFGPDDGLVFGNESSGAPEWLHAEIGPAARVRIPQFNPDLRSLNLSTSVGVAVYEAMRQLAAAGHTSVLTASDRG